MSDSAPEVPEPHPVHPAAELFPMMAGDEYQALKEDIHVNGQNLSIATWTDPATKITYLLDGRNRDRACRELGITPTYKAYAGADPVAFVVSQNLHRRHLTESQRAMIAAQIANLRDGQTKAKVGKFAELPPVTQTVPAQPPGQEQTGVRAHDGLRRGPGLSGLG
jgi:hypothetical protein